jgi:hypothetical protein
MSRTQLIPIVTALLLLSSSIMPAHAETANWNYLVKTYPLMGNDSALSQAMNKLGAKGWELVNCTEGDAEITCIFKRPEKE